MTDEDAQLPAQQVPDEQLPDEWDPDQLPAQHGRTFVVTGANSGTGFEAALALAGAGAHVVLAVRDGFKGQAAADRIRGQHPDASLDVRRVDLASLRSVRGFAADLLREVPRIDVLVNNAGVMAPPRRFQTVDGFELQLGTNFLGPFALTNLLLPRLLESPAPRVVTMSSGVALWGRIHHQDLQWVHGYRPQRAYAQSKLADLYLAQHLARAADARGWDLRSTAAHPGFARTNLQTAGAALGRDKPRRSLFTVLPVPSQSAAAGAEPLLAAATDPAVANGAYLGPAGPLGLVGPPAPVHLTRRMRDPRAAAWLWQESERLTGTHLPH
ncbi:oxidoreductase [Cellulomonas sp. HZM]|uniref:oxidoreductase n=1 Tax=Cellulomonas sp. HZM TaxID=1454010 RepID=UPI001E53AAD3|nr:oxidoreductase [Cellulomonas sp. HZM]